MHMPRLSWRLPWFIDETVHKREGSTSQGRRLTYEALELGSNNFPVTLVSCLGFFTSSYLLFANTTVLPMLGFVYWHDDTTSLHESKFNNVTIAGCIGGMVGFGIAADVFGRRKIYGYEILLLMLGTVGVVMSSAGYIPFPQANGQDPGSIDYSNFGSMDINSWLLFWRFCSGVGIGGEYPLTAVIASEFAPTRSRPRMLATVFAMQSVAIAMGAIVSLVVTVVMQSVYPYDPAHPEASAPAVDSSWRWVMGLALIPGLVTAIMRFSIPESPRYTLDILDDPVQASEDARRLRGLASGSEVINTSTTEVPFQHSQHLDEEQALSDPNTERQHSSQYPEYSNIKRYFWTRGNWRTLLATVLIWFLEDFAIFSVSLNEAPTLSKFWFGSTGVVKDLKNWDSDTADQDASIFTILLGNSVHLLVIESIPLLIGSVLLIIFITRINRRLLTWVMFLVTGTLLIITGATLLKTVNSPSWGISIALFALCKFAKAFSIGPLTFLLPAELFPTRYRASCHGISAGLAKLGSVLASTFLGYMTFGDDPNKVTQSGSPIAWLGCVLMVFATALFLGAAVSWLWIPELQYPSHQNKTLEELANGRPAAMHSEGRSVELFSKGQQGQ